MTITEYGEFMLFGSPAILDEWGFRKIDGILEDGRKVIIVGLPITIDGQEVKSITIDGDPVTGLTIDGVTVF